MPLTYRVFKDPFPTNPRAAYQHPGSIWLWHPIQGVSPVDDQAPDFVRGAATSDQKRYHTLPIYYQRNTGRVCTACIEGHAVDLAGIIYISQERAREYWPEFGEAEVKDVLRQEIDELEMYLTGDVWAYEVKDTETGEIIAASSGIYGAGEVVAQALDCVESFEFLRTAE